MTNEHPEEQTFDFQLIRITYKHRTEWEDGPGSLKNIVSDETGRRVIYTWIGVDAEFGERLARDGIPYVVLIASSDNGWYGYSYQLERRSAECPTWEYAGYISSNRADEWDEGPEDETPGDPTEPQWPEQKCFCLSCGTEVPDTVIECAACEAAWTEKFRSRCCACHAPVNDEQVICDDCDRKYARERLAFVLEFFFLEKYWWRELLYYLKEDMIGPILKRMRR